ncbi:MAG: hypothetical protein QM667_12735 [Asticcacaulis sp.]
MSEPTAYLSLIGDLLSAALVGLNLWPAVAGGVVAGFFSRIPAAGRLMLGLCLTLLGASLWPMAYGLPPIVPDFGEPEFVIQFSLMALVVFGIIAGLSRLRPFRTAS